MKLIDVEPIIKNLSAMKTQLGYDAIEIDGMIKALREAEEVTAAQQPNNPLTLDELREMDGEPVWIERRLHQQAGWALVRVWSKWSKAKNAICLIYRNGNTEEPGCVLADGGKIYRRKPEEVGTCQKTSSLIG